MHEFEEKIIKLAKEVFNTNTIKQKTFNWLLNTHLNVNSSYYRNICNNIFLEIGGNISDLAMKGIRQLNVDAYFSEIGIIMEIDEIQHFTSYRKESLNIIKKSDNIPLGYNINDYILYCTEYGQKAIKKGAAGYRKPTKDFNFINGRAAQRAYLDSIRDVLSVHYLSKPVFRISEIEIDIYKTDDEIKEHIFNKYNMIYL